jgi:hypothetical protein
MTLFPAIILYMFDRFRIVIRRITIMYSWKKRVFECLRNNLIFQCVTISLFMCVFCSLFLDWLLMFVRIHVEFKFNSKHRSCSKIEWNLHGVYTGNRNTISYGT